MASKLVVNCPRCQTTVSWSADSPFRPFCSERCKFMDLGAWATEKYRVAAPGNANDHEDNISQQDDGTEPG
jgi:endogenous inhibitor of DNA gyrase (YacG/DUF329 family)